MKAEAAAPPPETIVRLPIGELSPSPTNPRKTFDDAKLAELAESIRTHGVLQDVLVRPVGGAMAYTKGRGWDCERYEIVAGERRWRAAKLAGLTVLQVKVRHLADADVLAVQLVENDRRADVAPSEQAAAYKRLADAVGIEEAARRVGATAGAVRTLARLANLPAWVLACVDRGELPRSVAEVLSRVPGEEHRERACVAAVLDAEPYQLDEEDYELCRAAADGPLDRDCLPDGPMTFRDTKNMVRRHFSRELKAAPFDRLSLDLVPDAGSCDACPKRAGNDPELVAEGVREDVCTDPACFVRKAAAHAAVLTERAAADGKRVMNAAECDAEFMSFGGLRYGSKYIDLSEKLADGKSWRSLIGKSLDPADVAVGVDGAGVMRSIVLRSVAEKHAAAMRSKGGKPAVTDYESQRQERSRKEKRDNERYAAAASLACGRVAEEIEAAKTIGSSQLRRTAVVLAGIVGGNARRIVANRRGVKTSGLTHDLLTDAVVALVGELDTAAELQGFVAELVAAELAERWAQPFFRDAKMKPRETDFWGAFNVDRALLLRQVDAEAKAAKAEKKKKTAKKGK